MNRKLLNGLLVFTVAAGGLGTFTSCKDIDERSLLNIRLADLQAQIDSIKNTEQNQLKQQVTSMGISQTVNPVFGTINLPIGLNSKVLASYVYESNSSVSFPGGAANFLSSSSRTEENLDALDVISSIATSETLKNGSFTAVDNSDGNMGNAYITINPSTVDFSGVDLEIVNYKGEVVLGSSDISVTANTDPLHFGISRAGTNASNLYKIQANVPSNYQDLIFELENKEDLVNALKSLLNNHTKSDIATLAQTLFDSMKNLGSPLAVRSTWYDAVINSTSTGVDEIPYSTVSDYELAAAVLQPLSYTTPIGEVLGNVTSKRLPKISKLSEYLNKIGNKLTFTITTEEYQGIKEFEIEFSGNGTLVIYDKEDPTKVLAELEYSAEGIKNPEEGSLDELIANIINSIQGSVNGVVEDINNQLQSQIDNINNNLKNAQAKLGRIQDYLEEIKKSKKLAYAQDLVNVYNAVADRVNNFLDSPERYLQVMMAYQGTDGNVHHVSTDKNCGTLVKASAVSEDGLKLYTTSYTGDVVVPSYKKYVAITSVNGSTANLKSINEKAGLNNVYSGTEQEVFMNVDGLSGTVELSYVSVDYHGKCSMQTYYLEIQ